MLIEVKETHPPKAGRKTASVIAMDGQRFDIWPDKISAIKVGCRYDIEVNEREYDGRKYYSIKKATPVDAAPSAAPPTAAAPTASGEAEYVGRTLHGLILKGDVTLKNLETVTSMLRNIWSNTSPEATHYRHAAE